MNVTGVGDQDKWYYEWTAISNPRWWNDYYLTNNYYYDRTPTFTGNYYEPPYAYSSPSSSGYDNIAWGYYEFTFQMPDDSFSKSFYLDLRDANWSMEQPPYPGDPDTKIRWDHTIQKFEFKNAVYTNWTSFSAGSHKTIWGLFNISTPKQDVFQPTPPRDFECTNTLKTGENPHFIWWWPDEPDIDSYAFNYKIYRSENFGPFYCVASNLSFEEPPLEWTDYGVSINSNGIRFVYYATAYTDQSPESDESNWTRVYGYPYKAVAEPATSKIDSADSVQAPSFASLSAYPNPFNSSSTICYDLPTASYATLKIFNLHGEVVKKLADGYQIANHYQVIWNGENEVGVKVAAGIYLCQMKTDNYSQLKRIIFIK